MKRQQQQQQQPGVVDVAEVLTIVPFEAAMFASLPVIVHWPFFARYRNRLIMFESRR
jgi:hypothetical protein